MSHQDVQSVVISDPFRFAADLRSLGGEVRIAALERLADFLANTDGVVSYRIDGSVDEQGKPRLRLVADGRLELRCQRCLEGMSWDLVLESVLQPVRPGQGIPDEELEDDEVDAFEVEADLDVIGLVEDEILLALPIAPRHENCDQPRPVNGEGKQSPFAVLAGLRGGGKA
ncbi:metal-binding protein [Azoarcus sp. DD4]|uniref:YceD family protein n=1 Tax=Azoarcus sp. DD4 TaxID=2027405 RepID=UPI0011269B65|nr:YceD family protein [Azoarcus sp. DD4]QDF96831.1 metal-binding protein [Azoarcus sp. DD4]